MLLDMLVLLDSILQMQLFQINQSEDSSKITTAPTLPMPVYFISACVFYLY